MDDINKFPRVGNASFYDFENSFVNVIFEAAPNPLRGSLDVCGFVTLTITDVFILILRHLWIPITTLLSFYFLYKKHAWVFEKWGSLVFWFKMIVNYTLLISFVSIRANIALAFKPIARNTRADQKRTDKSPDKAAISSTNIPTTTFEELFANANSGKKDGSQAPTELPVTVLSLPKKLVLGIASAFAWLWRFVKLLFFGVVSIFVLLWRLAIRLVSTIFAIMLMAFRSILAWMLNHYFIVVLVLFWAGSIYAYTQSNPNAAIKSPMVAFFGDVGQFFHNIPGYLKSFTRWILFNTRYYGIMWGNEAIWGSVVWVWTNLIWYPLSYVPSWPASAWKLVVATGQYVLPLISSWALQIGLIVLSIVVLLYSRVLFACCIALGVAIVTLGLWEPSPCANSVGLTAFSLVIIAFVAWATQAVVDFLKRICPHICDLPFSVLTWQPIVWVAMLLFGQHLNIFSISKFLRLYASSPWLCVFLLLAVFKGLKIFVHTVSFYLWTRPATAPRNPTTTPADVTVIIPSVGEFGQDFKDTVESIIINGPARIIVSTVGLNMVKAAKLALLRIEGGNEIEVVSVDERDKRLQLLKAVQEVRTFVTVYADDHVIWPATFLRSALAPFEDPIVGLVATSKRVIRNRNMPFWDNFFNYIACIYLERHNFECTATNNIDGGVFVISGRTALARTSVLHSLEYRSEFQSEFFATIGPMKVDDDNFNTRFMVRHGWKTIFHNEPRATIETTLVDQTGKLGKFRGQLLRWTRTTWRSNLKSLITDRACYRATPWTTYAMFFSSFINFAIFYDAALFYSLKWSGSGHMCSFLLLLLISKLIKPLQHLLREPQDWKWVPFGILFGYFHSFVKLYSMFTMGNIDWTGRQGITAKGSK
jgi:hypothetical protein